MARFVEADDVAEVASAILARSMPREAISPTRFTRQVLLDPNFRKEGSILALEEGRPVGYGLSVVRSEPVEGRIEDADRGYLWLLGVVPEARGRGIGTELLRRMESHMQRQGRRVFLASCYSPGYFQPGVDVDAYPEGVRLLERNGYREVAQPVAMETSLWDLEVPEWTIRMDEVRLTRNPFEVLPRLLQFAHAEFGPDWARYVRESAIRQLDGDSKTGLTIAMQGEEVLGFGHFDGERFGPIGVAERHRGKAVGHRIMFDVLQRQREAGYRVSWFLWSDKRTYERLYSHAGFRLARQFSLMKKELD